MVMHACNPRTWEAEIEDHRFEASLSNLVRPSFKIKNKSRAWWHMLVIPVPWEAGTGGSGFAASLSALSLSLSLSVSLYLVRPSATL